MKKKKLVAYTMAAMMTAMSLFAGCSDKTNPEDSNNSTTSTNQDTSKNPTAIPTDNI